MSNHTACVKSVLKVIEAVRAGKEVQRFCLLDGDSKWKTYDPRTEPDFAPKFAIYRVKPNSKSKPELAELPADLAAFYDNIEPVLRQCVEDGDTEIEYQGHSKGSYSKVLDSQFNFFACNKYRKASRNRPLSNTYRDQQLNNC